MLLHDLVGNGQAQSRALAYILGGEERVEDLGEDVLGNAVAVVGHVHPDLAGTGAAGGHRDFAAGIIGGLGGIGDQIEEHLIDLGRRAFHQRNILQLLAHDLVLDQAGRDDQRARAPLVEIEALQLAAVQPAEVLQVENHFGNLVDAVQAVVGQPDQIDLGRLGFEFVRERGHACELGRQLLVRNVAALEHFQQLGRFGDHAIDLRQPILDRRQTGFHVGERRVDLMGNAGHHLSERGHLLGLNQHRLRFFQMLERLGQLLGAALYLDFQILVGRLQRLVGLVDLHVALAQLPHT